jgi:beta-phosphoglucomutase family hydrolase
MNVGARVRLGHIFDLDGTLADTMPAHYRAWQSIVSRYGLTFSEARFYELGGVPTAEIARMLVEESGLCLDFERVAREKQAAFAQALAVPGSVTAIEPVVAIAREKRKDSALAVASGGTRDLVERTLSVLGLAGLFDEVVTAEDTPKHKPNPDVFLEASRRIGIPPERCTVYEDTELGLEAGRRAGMRVVDVRLLLKAQPRPLPK